MPPLDFDAFRKSVLKGEILPAYYLHGDEELLKDDGLRDLVAVAVDPGTRDFNCDRRRAADLTAEEFATLALTPPMMAARRAVIITEAEALQQRRPRAQALRDAIVAYLARPAAETMLVLVQSAGDKPDPALDRLAASVAFLPLTPDRLERWIRHRAKQEGVELDADGAQHLKKVVGDHLPQLAAEIAKLGGTVRGRVATADDIADLVGVRRGQTAYDFVDAVTGRHFDIAAPMVRRLLEGPGNSGVRLVGSLATALTGVALARALLDRGTAPGPLVGEIRNTLFQGRPWGLRGYDEEARRWVADAARWTQGELEAALSELLRADKRLKNTTLVGEVETVTEALLAMATARVAA